MSIQQFLIEWRERLNQIGILGVGKAGFKKEKGKEWGFGAWEKEFMQTETAEDKH